MSASIEFTPLATSDPLDSEPLDNEPITTKPKSCPAKGPSILSQVERITDAAISGLGPILLTVALILLSMTIFCYFSVFLPYHYSWKEGEGLFGNLGYILNLIWSLYLVWGIIANYYFAVRTPPGGVLDGLSASGDAMFQSVLQEMESNLPKPERTHHCSVCKTCVLKYDHDNWPYWLDRAIVAFSVVLAVAIGFAVGGMACWHWYLALTAQTTLEQYNNAYIKKICKKRNEKFTNMYDFGVVGNLQDVFNIGPRGHYPWYTALLPLRIPPIGNGKRFERSGRGYVLDFGEDDEDMV
ncbi:hypothetical protein BGX21_011129 [Mortierella sp. AD011]|nr:hypothetical protein BGX21_011129 [Mortierella sp. AD011]